MGHTEKGSAELPLLLLHEPICIWAWAKREFRVGCIKMNDV